MFNKHIALASLCLAAIFVPQLSFATSPLSEFQIQEVLCNPKGSPDETLGFEHITLRGPAGASLDGYCLVVVENESNGGSDGRGRIDNIIPLDGYVSNANGYFTVRDTTDNQGSPSYGLGTFGGTGDPFTGQSWPSRNGTASEMKLDFTSSYSISLPARGVMSAGTLSFGGNTLENEGGNYFLVKNINPAMVQQMDDVDGNKISNGTALDSDHTDGKFDYFRGTGTFSGTRPWETTVDGFYISAGSDVTNSGSSLDYVSASNASRKAVFLPTHSGTLWTHTADFVVRLSNSSGTPLTHLDGSSRTIDNLLGIELKGSNQQFETGSDQERLYDGTTISFSGTSLFAFPTTAFTITVGANTYYHP